jgi:ATP-dependent DNA ligase
VPPPGICLVPVAEDAPALWDTWVGQGGEGIVLKERTSVYRSGIRSPAWLKLKPKLTLEVVVIDGRISGTRPVGRLGRSRDARLPP